MTTTATAPEITTAHLLGGEEIAYGGELYRVAEGALPVAVLGGDVVIANPADGRGGWSTTRVALYFANGGPVDLLAHGGAE
ncbi:hypothetical protein [Catellatospora sp. NPDC049609]|uniref:hypothetical protein n=1 Tax=Catellatospora sp. NPDC049609 TaxID=3155505 RepID=UPI003439BB3C